MPTPSFQGLPTIDDIAEALKLDYKKETEAIEFIHALTHDDMHTWLKWKGIEPDGMSPTQIIQIAKLICLAFQSVCPIVDGM